MYEGEDYDLAGFCVGVVEQSKIIDGSKVKADDVLIGIASSGAHSNGYSLLRKILDVKNVDLTQIVDGRPLADTAMEPTRIYVKPILELLKQVDVHAMAHITGGGYRVTYRAYFQMVLKQSLMNLLGNGQNCLNFFKRKVVLNNLKCTAHLTVA